MKRWGFMGNRRGGAFAQKRRTLHLSEAAWQELACRAAEQGLGVTEYLENWAGRDLVRGRRPEPCLPVEEQLQARNRELLTLYKILEATLKDGPLQSIYAEIVEEMGTATSFPIVAIELYDPNRRVMVFAGVRGVALPSDGVLEVPVDETLSGTVVYKGKSVVRHYRAGETKQCDANDTLNRLGIATFVCVPMRIEERVVGVLSLAHPETVAVDAAFVRWVEGLAGNIASLTERRRVEEALRRSHEQLEARVEERTAIMVRLNERLQQEVSERRLSSERLELSEAQLLGVLDNSTAVIHIKDLEGNYILVNRQYEVLTHIDRAWLRGRTEYDVFPTATAELLRDHDSQVIAAGRALEFEEEIPLDDGVHTYLAIKFPIFDAAGVPFGVCGISSDISSRKRVEETLRQGRAFAQQQVEELARLNTLKDEFLSTVSHELRTPLANIRLAIEMLGLASDPALRGRYLDILRRECRREIQLVNDLLELQSLTAGARPLTPEPVTLCGWLAAVTEPFFVRTQQRGQRLRVETAEAPERLLIDRAGLERIAVELLTNACKYTPTEGEIVVRFAVEATAGDSAAVLIVANTGMPILPEDQARIFEKFYRVPGSDLRQEGGTGLGLALVQKLVEQMAGTIGVESNDGWTRFRVEFARDVLALPNGKDGPH